MQGKGLHPAVGLSVIGVVGFVLLGVMPKPSVDSTYFDTSDFEQEIYDEVARDAIQQYELTKMHGNEIDRCVQAGLVAQAYLQAGKGASYESWKQTESRECRQAGL